MSNVIELAGAEKKKSNEKEQMEVCQICFRKHPPFECTDGFSGFPEEKKKRVFSNILASVERSGVGAMRDSGWQRILAELSRDEDLRQQLFKKIISKHGMGEYVSEKGRDGKIAERFEAKDMLVRIPNSDKMEAIRLDKNPIGYDNDFDAYVVRYNPIREDGRTDPVVKKNTLDMLAFEKEDLEKRERRAAA